MTILYCNVNSIRDNEIGQYLEVLPDFMKSEIAKQKFLRNQKLTLGGRLMLYQMLYEEGVPNLIHFFQRTAANKPTIDNWSSFNISHSNDFVVFCKDNGPVGIDIEATENINWSDLVEIFHPEEQLYVQNSVNMTHAFFEIWVKKESWLKAEGIGIVNGVNKISCIGESLLNDGRHWHFHEVEICLGYLTYVCSLNARPDIKVREFDPKRYQKLLSEVD